MLVQIYEVTSAEEASALTKLGVDHIGVLVGKGEFPREQSIEAAKRIFVGIPPSSKGSALCLSADLSVIELVVVNLRPAILHLGASANLVRPEHVLQLKTLAVQCNWVLGCRIAGVRDSDLFNVRKADSCGAAITLS